jgi:transcriptional regulator with GAF, ATPase, and Fis domain
MNEKGEGGSAPTEEAEMGREQQLSDAFVGLADTLGADFDVVDLFERLAARCVGFSGAAAAGIVLSDGRGRLRCVAASQERAALIELLQLQTGDGPCLQCYRSGAPLLVARAAAEMERWPRLVPSLLAAGFAAVLAVPLRLRENTIGAVNLFYAEQDPEAQDDLHLVQALADVAALAMLNWPSRGTRPEDILARLQATITNKATIEQAKGFLAETGGVSVEEAGAALRAYASTHGVRATDTARAVVHRRLPASEVLAAADTHGDPQAQGGMAHP